MQNTAKIGSHKLIFGTFATRKFCFAQGCTNEPETILAEFAGPRKAEALYNIVGAGIQSALAEKKEPFDMSEFEISALIDTLDEKPELAEQVINAFVGSVVNKTADEVPAWIKEVQKEAERLAKEEAEAATPETKEVATTGGKSKAVQVGKASRTEPTVTD